MPNPRIKNEDQYEALRDKGYSKEKSARIANTPDSRKKGAEKPNLMRNGPKKIFMNKQKMWELMAVQK